eukprot:scaffold10860_cov182-Amphora_coffeaeformis.AAC.14
MPNTTNEKIATTQNGPTTTTTTGSNTNRTFYYNLMKVIGTVTALTTLLGSLWTTPTVCFTTTTTFGSATSFLSSTTSSDSTRSTNNNNSNMPSTPQMMWFQKEISITAPSRGCHLITNDILKAVGDDLRKIDVGLANLFVQHTSASLTINENADPDVRRDMEVALNKLSGAATERFGIPWKEVSQREREREDFLVPPRIVSGVSLSHAFSCNSIFLLLYLDDDMPGHVKSSMMGVSLNVPIKQGRLALGTWQGAYGPWCARIYLNEHRDTGGWGGGHTRRIVITLQGQGKA